jgi:hypothetical protein
VVEKEAPIVVLAKKFYGLSPFMLELVMVVSGVLGKW